MPSLRVSHLVILVLSRSNYPQTSTHFQRMSRRTCVAVRCLPIHSRDNRVLEQFVYPYTLEPHILTLESARQSTLAAHAARREAYLRSREDEKERRKREALRRIAPGFEPQGVPLVPVRVERPLSGASQSASTNPNGPPNAPKSVMDDLVDQLAALDARTGAANGGTGQLPSNNATYISPSFPERYQ
jgi:hypothetical protein